MSENTEPKLPETNAPEAHVPQEDIPEEGFVPYVTEAAAEAPPRKKKIRIILIALAALLLISLIIILPGLLFNFYRETMKTLSFDYRDGESADTENKTELGAAGRAVAAQTDGHTVKMEAVSYLFDENMELDETVSVYDYTHGKEGNSLKIKTGANDTLFTRKAKYPEKDSSFVPDLYSYCFAVKESQNAAFSCYDSYKTVVKGKQYTCEIWHMNSIDSTGEHHHTFYRYYDGGRLAGVCILLDSDDMVEVLDIRSYTVS